MHPSIKWAAELDRVRELSLAGTADLDFWREHLREHDLVPAESQDGQAQIQVVAADATFMGVRFRELSFSVLVRAPEREYPQGATYLVGAFNSSRFFAYCERAFFSTPYDHGDVRLSGSPPASIHLAKNEEGVFRAELRAMGREPARRGEQSWMGPVFLPEARPGKVRQGNLFYARLSGQTQTYPFLPDQDSLMLAPAPASTVLQLLHHSRFTGKEWAVREAAAHAKSKTYKRAAMQLRGTAASAPETEPGRGDLR